MSVTEWSDIQEAFLYVFLPVIQYSMACLVAGAMIGALIWVFMDLFRRMTRK